MRDEGDEDEGETEQTGAAVEVRITRMGESWRHGEVGCADSFAGIKVDEFNDKCRGPANAEL